MMKSKSVIRLLGEVCSSGVAVVDGILQQFSQNLRMISVIDVFPLSAALIGTGPHIDVT